MLLSPVSTAVSSAERLALYLCVQTHKVEVCVTEPASSCTILIDHPRFPTTADKIFLPARGREEKTLEVCALSAPYTHSGSSLVTGFAAVLSQDSTWMPFPHTKKSPNSRRLPRMTSALERICNNTRGCNGSWQNT